LHDAARREPTGDAEVWCAAWTKLALQVADVAVEASNSGKVVTAADAFYRASQYYQWAEAFLAPDDPRTTDLYASHLDTFSNFARLSSPEVEIIEIPFEGSSLKAYFVPAKGPQERSPVVVLSDDGLDGTKEEMFLVARALSRRGIVCLGVLSYSCDSRRGGCGDQCRPWPRPGRRNREQRHFGRDPARWTRAAPNPSRDGDCGDAGFLVSPSQSA